MRVVSRHQVLEQTIDGKAWLVIGNMDISPDQQEAETVDCTVLNLKNGEMFSPSPSLQTFNPLTKREAEILRLVQNDSVYFHAWNGFHEDRCLYWTIDNLCIPAEYLCAL